MYIMVYIYYHWLRCAGGGIRTHNSRDRRRFKRPVYASSAHASVKKVEGNGSVLNRHQTQHTKLVLYQLSYRYHSESRKVPSLFQGTGTLRFFVDLQPPLLGGPLIT
jgi:hypothetical protein